MNMDDYTNKKFPWLKHLAPVAEKIVKTLFTKEENYQGSWQKRGGAGAFMMLARKWDRIENISTENHNDIFKVVKNNTGDIVDDIDDLIGYLLLVRSKVISDNEDTHQELPQLSYPEYELDRAQKIVNMEEPSPPAGSKHRPLKG